MPSQSRPVDEYRTLSTMVKSDGVTDVVILAKVAVIGSTFAVVNQCDDKNVLHSATVTLDKLTPPVRKHVLNVCQKARDKDVFVKIAVDRVRDGVATMHPGSTHRDIALLPAGFGRTLAGQMEANAKDPKVPITAFKPVKVSDPTSFLLRTPSDIEMPKIDGTGLKNLDLTWCLSRIKIISKKSPQKGDFFIMTFAAKSSNEEWLLLEETVPVVEKQRELLKKMEDDPPTGPLYTYNLELWRGSRFLTYASAHLPENAGKDVDSFTALATTGRCLIFQANIATQEDYHSKFNLAAKTITVTPSTSIVDITGKDHSSGLPSAPRRSLTASACSQQRSLPTPAKCGATPRTTTSTTLATSTR